MGKYRLDPLLLEVHHKRYLHRKPWQDNPYWLNDIVPLVLA